MSKIRNRFVYNLLCNWQSMLALFLNVFRFSPVSMMAALVLMLFRSITSGVGLLLIIPLLQVTGLSVGFAHGDGLSNAMIKVFHKLNIPLSLGSILIGYSLVVSVVALAAFGEQVISNRLQERYTHHLRIHLYRQLLCSRWAFFLKQTRPGLLNALTAQIQAISMLNCQLLTFLGNAIMLTVYTSLALLLSWPLTLVAVLCAGVLSSVMLPLNRLSSVYGRFSLRKSKELVQAITEHLIALKMIKASGVEEKFAGEMEGISQTLEKRNRHMTLVMAASKLCYQIGAVIGFSILLYVAVRVLAVPVESLLLLLVIFSRLLPNASNIQQNYQRILHHLPTLRDVKALLQNCVASQELFGLEPLVFQHRIILHKVGYIWPSRLDRPVFENLSVCIQKNTTTAIIGPSGAGKTTLADVIIGLLEPTSGLVMIDQQRLDDKNRLAWRQSVVYVTQDTVLFNATIRDNLQLYSGALPEAILFDALKQAGADDFVASLEDGLKTIIGDGGIRLSGGERQRIALARALLAKPQLLVLDECTSSLDRENRIKIQQALQRLNGKMTILIISHQQDMRDFADQIIVLNDVADAVYEPA